MLILKRVAPVVYRALQPTRWGAISGRSPLEAIFTQDAVVDMDRISLISTSLDVRRAFPNPHIAFSTPSGSTWDFLFKAFRSCTSPPACTRCEPM